MRQIKFKRYHFDFDGKLIDITQWGYLGNSGNGFGFNSPAWISNEDKSKAIDCQFTGIHDRNGKEIYEGDIIKDSEIIYEIRFGCYLIEPCEYTGFYMWDNQRKEAGMIGECDQSVIEIIGDIYSTPELIK